MKELLLFPFRGVATERENSVAKKIAKTIAGYFIVMILWGLFLLGLSSVVEIPQHNAGQEAIQKLAHLHPYLRLFMVAIVAPTIEELMFRLPLKPKKYYLVISTLVLSFYLSLAVFSSALIIDYHWLWAGIIALIMSIVVWFFHKGIGKFIATHRLLVIYISCLVFALLHYETYDFTRNIGITLIIIGQLTFLAFYMAFARLKYGFSYAVLVHCLHNFLVSLALMNGEITGN